MTTDPKPHLLQRLRRLDLLDDNDFLTELPTPDAVQLTLLTHDGTRTVMRMWADSHKSDKRPDLGVLLIVLAHLRDHPFESAEMLKSIADLDYATELTKASLDAARELHVAGRRHYGDSRMDLSVIFMLEAQREFLFAVTSGRLSRAESREALGKYAVAVAFSSRWVRTPAKILRRACEFQQASIDPGNVDPAAFAYLVELQAELFNQTGEQPALDSALALARAHGFTLDIAFMTLKQGMLKQELDKAGANGDLQTAQRYAEHAQATTGVEFVVKALVPELALAAILQDRPLSAREIRLPYGFLLDLRSRNAAELSILSGLVSEALLPMREMLQKRNWRPNLVAQQILTGVFREQLERSGYTDETVAEQLVSITGETAAAESDRHFAWQHVDALLTRALTTDRTHDVHAAFTSASELVSTHPAWPLPRISLARATELSNHGGDVARQQAWSEAVGIVVNSAEYRRTDLGGRSGVFAVDDARGELAATLVFKPVIRPDVGEREAIQLERLAATIAERGLEHRFGVARSLGVFEANSELFVHVIERQTGQVLATLESERAERHLDRCAELLALYHIASADEVRRTSSWRDLKNGVGVCAKSLFGEDHRHEIVSILKGLVPSDVPLVRKRDAHGGNWLVDTADRVIAIDLGSPHFLPMGHDVAQLVEDSAFLPVSTQHFDRRYRLFQTYLAAHGTRLDTSRLRYAYDFFALLRSMWLATSSEASKAQHSHARQVANHVSKYSDSPELQAVAGTIALAMQSVTSQPAESSRRSQSQTRLSKAMSRALRHRAEEMGLEPNAAGFVAIDGLARALNKTVDEIVDVASDPSEPRFQILNEDVRALYGHSFPVSDLDELSVEMPGELFHGTSWDHVSDIAAVGLRPQTRQHVHLTNNPAEAIEVARRHGHPLLLAVRTDEVPGLRAVADAVWAADAVEPASISVRNVFADLAVPPSWLTDDPDGEPRRTQPHDNTLSAQR